LATPFVQGRLLDRDLGCTIDTVCAISGQAIHLELDSELRFIVHPPAEKPLFVIPLIDLLDIDSPCIVDDF
jgi:hypothetical protein